jgi:hypothetical protein
MFFSRRKYPIAMLLIGSLLLITSIVLLFVNEGSQDFSKQVKNTIEIDLTQTDLTSTENMIAGYGIASSDQKIGDEYIQDDSYLTLERTVETFVREESKKGEGDDTYYNYKQIRTTQPQSSNYFNQKEGHENKFTTIGALTQTAKKVKIGNYDIDINKVTLPKLKELKLDDAMLKNTKDTSIFNNYIYLGSQNNIRPENGDIRISYKALK